MNSTCPTVAAPIVMALQRRETATAKMVRDIDDKIARLDAARRDRLAALQRVRAALVRAQQREQVGSERPRDEL
jgi:hypothetical protein